MAPHPQPGQATSRRKKVWLQCPGCKRGCGRRHEWDAGADKLTQYKGHMVCPYCESRGRAGRFCACQSVAADPRLSKEWHPDNPPSIQVARNRHKEYLWKCPEGHKPFMAPCHHRRASCIGCPECTQEMSGRRSHPSVSVGRPDLAEEWDVERINESPNRVTLGSKSKVWWRCKDNQEHVWQATVFSRALHGTGCPACRTGNRSKLSKRGTAEQ